MNAKEQLDRIIEGQFNRQIDDICRLVRIKSIRTEAIPHMPFGSGPRKALDVALKIAGRKGFLTTSIDDCIGMVEMEGREPGIDILAHLDVVASGTGWTVTEPFEPLVCSGRLYGRGTADNKGPAISVLYALDAVRSLGLPFKKGVRIIWGTAEETGSEDLPHFYRKYDPFPMIVSPDASFPVITKEKGRYEGEFKGKYENGSVLEISCENASNAVPSKASAIIADCESEEAIKAKLDSLKAEYNLCRINGKLEIMIKGKAAHAASPEKGRNALVLLLAVLENLPSTQELIKEFSRRFPCGDFSGKNLGIKLDELSGSITDIGRDVDHNSGFSVNLSSLRWNSEQGFAAVCDCRIPIGMTEESVVSSIKEAVEPLGITVTGKWTQPHWVSEDSEFIQLLLRCWEECSGRVGKTKYISGNTYAHGIPGAVAYGFADPDMRTRSHGPDEYIEISQLLLGTKIYAHMLFELCLL